MIALFIKNIRSFTSYETVMNLNPNLYNPI